jgi:alpha,alpha-trehalase
LDLYTAARRVGTEHVIDRRPLASSRYGVVGDGQTVALIGVDGSVDWLCWPRFDSPSVFAALLDPARGGRFQIAPAGGATSQQAYDAGTNVLQTLFRRDGTGAVMLTDHMPWNGDPRSRVNELHRLIEAREGALEMSIVFDPRFDYGRQPATIHFEQNGVMAEGPNGERISLSLGRDAGFQRRPEGGAEARLTLRSGQRQWVILSWRSGRPEKIAAYRPFDHLRATRRFWRSWSDRLLYDGPWRHDVQRGALLLKLLQYAPTGAMVAAPTTSLPAWIGGDRNWDYRFSWTRDSAMAIRAMNQIGYPDEAQGFFHFVRDTIEARRSLDIMVNLDGDDVPDEKILDHLAGHRDSRPVRIGNAARLQIQHDIIGPLLDAASVFEQSGGTLSLRLWRQVRRLMNEAIPKAGEPDHGIWEPRREPAHHVHSKLMTWVALDRAVHIGSRFGGDREEPTWRHAREAIAAEILERGYDATQGCFVGEYGGRDVDASLLLMPIYGFLPPRDERVVRTIDRVIASLRDGPFLRRYRVDDGIESDEGGFVLCGFWLAEALALAGRLDEALDVFQTHLSASNHLGLLSEEVDPATGDALGNFPQAFSHLGLIQAAARLDHALRLRDEGSTEPPLLPYDRPPGV